MMELKPEYIEMIGDKVLIQPAEPEERTSGGLYLPPGVKEKDQVQQGYIIKVGPGYMIPGDDLDEEWKPPEERVQFMPLQVEEGQRAVYLKKSGWEIRIGGEKYLIVPQSAILMVFSDDFVEQVERSLGDDED